jgi:hypothetical protein
MNHDGLTIIGRQMNMDYCLSEALKYNMYGIRRVILYYDIMCQFWKNLRRRFQDNPHLNFPGAIEIFRAIGLFHVHGHIDQCFARFAPTFIPGAGEVDGEVLETLWAVLNRTADSIRAMTTAHRRECLDDHMNDSNWKKLVNMGRFAVLSICMSLMFVHVTQFYGCARNCLQQPKS